MLTALAEFADGNRESAIRLLHNRIYTELDILKKLTEKGSAADLYSVVRKQAMIRNLIRMDTSFIELVQDPIRSPSLDQIAFDLIIRAIDLDPFVFMADQVKQRFDRIGIVSGQLGASSGFASARVATLTKSSVPVATAAILAGSSDTDAKSADDAMADDIVIAALKPIPGGRCSDQFVPVVRKDDRIAFYHALIDQLNFMNNALEYVGKNGQIVLSASWSGDKSEKPNERKYYTQSSLIKKLDGLAARMAAILNSQTRDPLSCLDQEGDYEPKNKMSNFVHASDLFDTLGTYFEMKGRNFGAAAAPQVTEYDEFDLRPCSTS